MYTEVARPDAKSGAAPLTVRGPQVPCVSSVHRVTRSERGTDYQSPRKNCIRKGPANNASRTGAQMLTGAEHPEPAVVTMCGTAEQAIRLLWAR